MPTAIPTLTLGAGGGATRLAPRCDVITVFLLNVDAVRTCKIYSVNCLLVYSLSVHIGAVVTALAACAAFVVTAVSVVVIVVVVSVVRVVPDVVNEGQFH